MIRAGEYRERITINSPSYTKQGSGEEIASWITFTTAWAKVAPQRLWRRSGESVTDEAVQARVSVIITMRYQAGITPDMRVVWGSHTYDILSVIDTDGLHVELEMLCIERKAAAV